MPAASAAVPAPSPQRPALSSPVASPSAIAAVAAATPTATVDASAGETYDVQSGDTLLTIADQFYSDVTQWRRIYDANKDVIGADPDKLKIGMKLKIPPKQ
ncbi:MAG TPA: LysM peptidoglycan-binding domain-containing protein [Chloroflexota bacterium]|nr:LysM peptidoglycan-binding domain-containing protein [Chloroflexota bacterium]